MNVYCALCIETQIETGNNDSYDALIFQYKCYLFDVLMKSFHMPSNLDFLCVLTFVF